MTILGIVVLVLAVSLGVPIWLSVASGATLILLGWLDPALSVSLMYTKSAQTSLLAVPLFMLAGQIIARAGVTKPLMDAMIKWVGHIPGGPAYAVIIAGAILAACSSSGMAALAGFGPVIIPMLIEMGYSKKFAIGTLIAASALGPLIPPSTYLIILGYFTETSVKDLYTAAIIPGLLLAGLLMATVFVHGLRGSYKRRPSASWRERWQSLWRCLPILVMPIIVLVPIYTGWFTATEAAVVCLFYSVFLGFVVYRKLNLSGVWDSSRRTASITAMLFIVVAAAFLLNEAFVYLRWPFSLSEAMSGAGFNAPLFMTVVIGIFFVMGCFLDPSAIMMVTAPMLLPTAVTLGVSPLAFNVLTAFSVEFGTLTPPYGLTLFGAVPILKEDFRTITVGVLYYWPALFLGQLLMAFFPQISTFLPDLLR